VTAAFGTVRSLSHNTNLLEVDPIFVDLGQGFSIFKGVKKSTVGQDHHVILDLYQSSITVMRLVLHHARCPANA
jgi:hypothetical protein